MRCAIIALTFLLGCALGPWSSTRAQSLRSAAPSSPEIDFSYDAEARRPLKLAPFETTALSLADGAEIVASVRGTINVRRNGKSVALFRLPQAESWVRALRLLPHPRRPDEILLYGLITTRIHQRRRERSAFFADSRDGGRSWMIRSPFFFNPDIGPRDLPVAWLAAEDDGTRLILESGKCWYQNADGGWTSERHPAIHDRELHDAVTIPGRGTAFISRSHIIVTKNGGGSFVTCEALAPELRGGQHRFARGSSAANLGIAFLEDRKLEPTHGDLKLWVGSLDSLLRRQPGRFLASIAHATPPFHPRPSVRLRRALRQGDAWVIHAQGEFAGPDRPMSAFSLTITESEAAARIPGRAPKLPLIDLNDEPGLHTVVDREPGQYLGHVTTCLLADGQSIIAVYPQGHGKGPIVMKRSPDGGRSWSERLPTPKNWATSREVPTIHPVFDPKTGARSLILWSGLYPARFARSEDEGATWSPLRPAGEWGGIVVMGSMEALKDGRLLALFHDDGRFRRAGGHRTNPPKFRVFAVRSRDAGRSWGQPTLVLEDQNLQPCEPGLIRSPDGKTLAVLLRENSRRANSLVIFSQDEGETWSAPRQLPADLSGDRHTARYAADGRLLICFRDMARESPTRGDWVAWVGRFENVLKGTPGQYRVRIKDNKNAWDSTYPGVEHLADDTFVLTTYGHWDEGEAPYILSVRLRLDDLDRRLQSANR